jgi:tetratricopeptide (TPR) repeat protein
MKDGKRKIPVLTKIFILTITLAAVIIPAVIIISSRVSSSREEKFTAAITAVDHARDAETPSRMAGLIRKSGKTAYSAKSWLMVLKRAYEYGKTENDWNLLAELSHDALEDFPGNERIAAAATVASVDSGNSAQAWETARRHLTGDRSRGIRTEAFLLNAFGTDKPALDEMTGGLASIPWSKDPSLFNEAYNMTGDRRFLMDAALLWLKTGNITEAIAYLDRSGSVPGAGYVKGLALYDAGRPEESYPLFLRELEKPAVEDAHRGELHLLAGDAAYRSRDYSDSAFHYRRAVSLAPGISPVPYLNLGRGFSSLPPEPALLERGFSLFPEDRKIAGALALHHIETGAPERAEAVVADFEGAEEGNISLLVLSELTNISNDTRFFVSLQRIHKAFPDNPLVTRYYLWQAVARRDFSRIRQILAESAAEKDTSWHRFYSALWNISRGRTADFPAVSEGMYGWYGSYNAIVLELRQGSVTAAILDKLTKPELYPAVSSRDMADAFALQAELYLKQKAPVVTIKETLEQGLAIDPLNIRIHSLIGSIESPE